MATVEEGREENHREAVELLRKTESVVPRAETWLPGEKYDETVVAPRVEVEARTSTAFQLGTGPESTDS